MIEIQYEIRPIWWRWWFSSPLYCLRRKIVFSVLLFLIFLPLLFHPFIPHLLPCFQVNWYIYMIFIAFLIFILLSPNVRTMRMGELEVELSSSLPSKPEFPPPSMERMMEEMRMVYTAGESVSAWEDIRFGQESDLLNW